MRPRDTITAPTIGFGVTRPRPRSASAIARAMKRPSFRSSKTMAPTRTPRGGLAPRGEAQECRGHGWLRFLPLLSSRLSRSAPELHRVGDDAWPGDGPSGSLRTWNVVVRGLYRRWGLAPRPEGD